MKDFLKWATQLAPALPVSLKIPGLLGGLPGLFSLKEGMGSPPPIHLGAEDIPVCMPSIWVDTSPVGVHKYNETSSEEAETDGLWVFS